MGNGKMVMLFKPEDIQTMYSSDGRIPMLPGFDNFEYSRNVSMKDRFPSAGLISNKVKFVYTFPMLFRPNFFPFVPIDDHFFVECQGKVNRCSTMRCKALAISILTAHFSKDNHFKGGIVQREIT